MKIAPERANFERIVIDTIKTGYLVRISTEEEENDYAFKSYRQVLHFLKTANKAVEGEE